MTATRSIVGNRFDGDDGGQVIHHRPVAGLRSRLRSALNNLDKGITVEAEGIPRHYLDATTGDIQLNLDWRASLSARLRHEQSSMNPVMADTNSIAESQQKPSDRPKHHPPREPVLQVIGCRFQSFTLSRGAGLDVFPFGLRREAGTIVRTNLEYCARATEAARRQ